MMNSRARKESDRKDKLIRALSIVLLVVLGLLGHAHFLLATLPKEFECHFPPDLSRGGMVKVNEFQRHEIYAFAFKIHQQLYRCEEDCAQDFERNIRKYGYYTSDSYRNQLLQQAQKNASSLRRRVRSISEYGLFSDNKVSPLGNGRWVVYLDVRERESIGGKTVRDALMRYPLIVARHDVDRLKNPWRLAIAGLHNEPRRL